MNIPTIEEHCMPIFQLLSAVRVMLEAIDDLEGENARLECSSSMRFLLEELQKRQERLYEALYAEHRAATGQTSGDPAND